MKEGGRWKRRRRNFRQSRIIHEIVPLCTALTANSPGLGKKPYRDPQPPSNALTDEPERSGSGFRLLVRRRPGMVSGFLQTPTNRGFDQAEKRFRTPDQLEIQNAPFDEHRIQPPGVKAFDLDSNGSLKLAAALTPRTRRKCSTSRRRRHGRQRRARSPGRDRSMKTTCHPTGRTTRPRRYRGRGRA